MKNMIFLNKTGFEGNSISMEGLSEDIEKDNKSFEGQVLRIFYRLLLLNKLKKNFLRLYD